MPNCYSRVIFYKPNITIGIFPNVALHSELNIVREEMDTEGT